MKPNKSRVMCPDCGREKIQFDTETSAKKFIEYNGHEISTNPDRLRVYYCPSCCCYHISSKPQRKNYNNTEKLINAYNADIQVIKKLKIKIK